MKNPRGLIIKSGLIAASLVVSLEPSAQSSLVPPAKKCRELVFRGGTVIQSGGGQLPVVTQISSASGQLIQVPSVETFVKVVQHVVATPWMISRLKDRLSADEILILPKIETVEKTTRSGNRRKVKEIVNVDAYQDSVKSSLAHLQANRRAVATILSQQYIDDLMLLEQLFTTAQAERLAGEYGMNANEIKKARSEMQVLLGDPQGLDMLISIVEASLMTVFEGLRARLDYFVRNEEEFSEEVFVNLRRSQRWFGWQTNLGLASGVAASIYGSLLVSDPGPLPGLVGVTGGVGYIMYSIGTLIAASERSDLRARGLPQNLNTLPKELVQTYLEALKRLGFDPTKADYQGPFMEIPAAQNLVELPEIPDFKLNRENDQAFDELVDEIHRLKRAESILREHESASYSDLVVSPLPENQKTRLLSKLLTEDVMDFSTTTGQFKSLVRYLTENASQDPASISSLQQLAGGYAEFLQTLKAKLLRHEDALYDLIGIIDQRQDLLLSEWRQFEKAVTDRQFVGLENNRFHKRAIARQSGDEIDWQRVFVQMQEHVMARAAADGGSVEQLSEFEKNKLALNQTKRQIESMRAQIDEALQTAMVLSRATNLSSATAQLAHFAQTVGSVVAGDMERQLIRTSVQ